MQMTYFTVVQYGFNIQNAGMKELRVPNTYDQEGGTRKGNSEKRCALFQIVICVLYFIS